MASKNINVLLSLVDRFTAPMRKVAESTKETQRHLKSASNTITNFGKGANQRFLSIAGSVGSLAAKFITLGGLLSVGGLIAYGKECMALAGAQGQAETKLAAILENVQSIQERGPGAVAAAKANLLDYAAALQKVGVVGDEVTIAGMQQLATFQLNDDEIKTLSGGMLDLLVQQKGLNATQEDAVGIANMIGKAMSGNAGALSRVGITMSAEEQALIKFGDAEQRAAVIAQVLKNNVGGVNEAMAKTGGGRNKQAMNAYGDMMENIGKRISPFKAKFMGMFANLIPAIEATVLPIVDKLGSKFEELYPTIDTIGQQLPGAISQIGEAFDKVYNAAIPVFTFIQTHSEGLLSIIEAVVAGFLAFNILLKIAAMFKLLAGAIWIATHAMTIFNIILAANPVGLICAAIAILIGLMVLIYQNWDIIKKYALIAINAIIGAITSVLEAIRSFIAGIILGIAQVIAYFANVIGSLVSLIWSALVSAITSIFEAIKSLITGIIDAIGQVINYFINVISSLGSIILDGLSAVLNAYIEYCSAYFEDLKVIFGGIIDFVTGIFTGNWEQAWQGVQDIFSGIFNALVDLAAGPLNIILGMVNRVIDSINSIDFKVPEWVPGIGGSQFAPRLDRITGFATGTNYFAGGLAQINEDNRGEMVNLPNGTQIIPHDKTIEQVTNNRRSPITIHLQIAGNVIGNEDFINQCGEIITQKVQMALHNS